MSARTEARVEGGRGVSAAGTEEGEEMEEGKAIPGLRKLAGYEGCEGCEGPQLDSPHSLRIAFFSGVVLGKLLRALSRPTSSRNSVQGRFWVTRVHPISRTSFPNLLPSFKFETVRAKGSTLQPFGFFLASGLNKFFDLQAEPSLLPPS